MELIIAYVVPAIIPSNETFDDRLIIEARALFNKINKTTDRHLIANIRDEVSKEADRLEKCIKQSVDPKAKYYVYKACDLYCIMYKKPGDRLPYLQKMIDIIENEITDIPERERALTRFKIADVLYDENKISDSYNYIYKLYTTQPESFKNLLSGFHILIETAILLKKYEIAEHILDMEFHQIIALQQEPYCTFAHLNYAKLYLHMGDYEKAIGQIIEIKKVIGQEPNVLREAQIRIYETMYFFLTGDTGFAGQLSNINKRFFEEQKIFDRSPDIAEVQQIINAFIEEAINKKPVSKEIMDSLKYFQKGPNAIFGELLTRITATLS
jgi:tetratricopeptide (TPR) repeat protein